MTAAECRLLEAEYNDSSFNGAEFVHSAALIVMALVLLMQAHSIKDNHGNGDDASTFLVLLLLRAAGFLLPCYIMVWAISILLHHRRRQEIAAALAASDAFMVMAAHHRGLEQHHQHLLLHQGLHLYHIKSLFIDAMIWIRVLGQFLSYLHSPKCGTDLFENSDSICTERRYLEF